MSKIQLSKYLPFFKSSYTIYSGCSINEKFYTAVYLHFTSGIQEGEFIEINGDVNNEKLSITCKK